MTTIANCLTLDKALTLKALLEANGIPAFIPDEVTACVVPHHFLAKSGVRLQVPEEHVEDARLIVGTEGTESP